MKSPLHLKVVIVLGYVALCTTLVLINHQADVPEQDRPAPAIASYE